MKKYFAIAAVAVLALAACTKTPTTGPKEKEETGAVKAAKGNLVINEVAGTSKFLELYNPTDKDVDLEGVTLLKNDETEIGAIWTGVADQVVKAKGFVILYSSKTALENPDPAFTFNGGLSGKKSVKMELFAADGTSIEVFVRGPEPWDTACAENTDCSFSRVPDGTGPFVYAAETPGAANGEKVADIVD